MQKTEKKEYKVTFGSLLSNDKFGFIRSGTVKLHVNFLEYNGKKAWSFSSRLLIFLGLTILPLVLFGFGFGFVPALLIIFYFCATDDFLRIEYSKIGMLNRKGKIIKFNAIHPETKKARNGVLKLKSEEYAIELEHLIQNKMA
ncbi:MAG: hypothetical protein ED557_08200 [Balneola sp.]|nr:MAG: hypothetical protein ED557_08200 [Balneola sp.]